ncbi:MAG: 16S rRNA (guanine(966)-N(2))-methyltransferase RsmD [Bryobacteraceae bacterium]
MSATMRVIGGEYRSRRLKTLPGAALRPTPDLLREALFDVLASRVAGAVFLDGYAGSGAVGIEALSRGASHAIFIEKFPRAVHLIHENLASLGLTGRATVVRGAVATRLAEHPAAIVFLDPPYPRIDEYRLALDVLGAAPPPLVVVQHSKRQPIENEYGRLRRTRTLVHGDSALTFLVES